MRKIFFLTVSSIFLLSSVSYSQECGTGTNYVNFIQKESIKYELFSVTPKGMNWYSQEAKDWIQKNLPFFYERIEPNGYSLLKPVESKDKRVEQFLKKYKVENFEPIILTNPQLTKAEGNTQNGVISFITGETLSQPLILKLSSKKYGNFYFLGAFLGGCSRSETFDLIKNLRTIP
jgi:hypothetical protein